MGPGTEQVTVHISWGTIGHSAPAYRPEVRAPFCLHFRELTAAVVATANTPGSVSLPIQALTSGAWPWTTWKGEPLWPRASAWT